MTTIKNSLTVNAQSVKRKGEAHQLLSLVSKEEKILTNQRNIVEKKIR